MSPFCLKSKGCAGNLRDHSPVSPKSLAEPWTDAVATRGFVVIIITHCPVICAPTTASTRNTCKQRATSQFFLVLDPSGGPELLHLRAPAAAWPPLEHETGQPTDSPLTAAGQRSASYSVFRPKPASPAKQCATSQFFLVLDPLKGPEPRQWRTCAAGWPTS